MRFSIIAAVVFAAAAAASPTSGSPHVLHEKRGTPSRSWVKRADVPGHAVLPFRIGLVQRNLERGHDLLMEVSDMNSPKYGQHYTADEVIDLFAPHQDSVDTVRNWLESAGIAAHRVGHSANKQWIMFDASVAEAEMLFKTKYHQWEHTGSGNMNIGCEE
jgi:tripeptidyl-peptidase I